MSDNIKLLRTQSILKEIIPEALSQLNDPLLRGLCVVDVECKRGKYDAFIYLDKMGLSELEQAEILNKLKKVNGYLQSYCREAEGWFRAPKFHFKFDDTLERQNQMDALFDKISKELKKDD
ncbi:30S ribosome-binding factor RbfA [Campylobacter corcagiensis]|uniref:Ribosome-binding factor A n=1 Tax=Campylobacter corcagiensis TaxID=1448857 RepID=A0A7M1LFZ7_9BACT|nr:30S ribosome-binding factor RbfA [Campylobacter corcagiensis]QKF64292.1 ribosome-binding factor A [Campylobacter corcagiensis]QOQ87519.1 30S ribosome-binding factor RbfA [Campylobacter corcagiensis]